MDQSAYDQAAYDTLFGPKNWGRNMKKTSYSWCEKWGFWGFWHIPIWNATKNGNFTRGLFGLTTGFWRCISRTIGHQRQRWPRMSFFGISADELMDCSHQLDGVEIDHIQVTGNWPIQGMTVSRWISALQVLQSLRRAPGLRSNEVCYGQLSWYLWWPHPCHHHSFT